MATATGSRIVFRKSVPQSMHQEFLTWLDEALTWMRAKYPSTDFETVRHYVFNRGGSRSRYYREGRSGISGPLVMIAWTECMSLYVMRSLGITTRKRLAVPPRVRIVCALIHELTHHHQYEHGLPRGELLTTANELEWMREVVPQIRDKFLSE
jgi:hypothetical protein